MDLKSTLNRAQQTLNYGTLVKEAGLEQNRRARAMLKLLASPQERVAAWAHRELDKILVMPLVNGQIKPAHYLPPMDILPDDAITLGIHHELKLPILIPSKKLTENLLVIGSVGSGKTSYLFWIIDQIVHRNIPVTFYDFKGEAPRLLNYYA